MTVKIEVNADEVRELKKVSDIYSQTDPLQKDNAVLEKILSAIFDTTVDLSNEADEIQNILMFGDDGRAELPCVS